ncbi:MAG: phosphatidylglycerophosphatase A [Candidatus Marinimicrobia bacterium]|nr:phosphatidylglycerophosphatase A [Candidatus Neomarinimicrobiota bacterium]
MKFRLAEILATVFYLGRIPGAPGTWGSMAAVLVWLILPEQMLSVFIFSGLLIFLAVIGIWASQLVESERGTTDPSDIIIDEWVGQWIALLALPQTWVSVVIALVFFRIFDIAKPWPIDNLQKLPGGWGIMVDDIVAGIIALGLGHLVNYLWL